VVLLQHIHVNIINSIKQKQMMELIIGIITIFGLMYAMGWALQQDLNEIDKNDPEFGKYLKNKYKW
jgi:hypothetical protein